MGTSPETKKAPEATAPTKPPAKFVARQPILTREEQVFGYELLFRDGVENYFRSTDPEAASRSTLDTSMLMGLDTLCGGRRAFLIAPAKFAQRLHFVASSPADRG